MKLLATVALLLLAMNTPTATAQLAGSYTANSPAFVRSLDSQAIRGFGADGQATCTFIRTATADSAAVPVSPPNFLQSGDFKIVGTSSSGDVGDGVDELTRWIYDYKPELETINQLDSTRLSIATLDVTYEGGGSNDEITVRGARRNSGFPSDN